MRRGDGVPQDPAAGASALEAACTGPGRISDACATLAVAYDEGHFLPVDEARATDFYLKACEAGLGDACRFAADRYRKGIGRPPNADTADSLYQRGCNAGDATSCRRAPRVSRDR